MKGTIKKTLKSIGLSEKESEIYIFLGKRGPLKGSEISRQLKANKGQIYRILKSLQKKGLVEATLEYPRRFTSVPFENVIDSFIRSKREEVNQIEESKDELLSDWKKINSTELESSIERFSVIEGEKKIFQKISQMIKETKKQFLSISSAYGLFRADNYGIFENIVNHSSGCNIKFRFLTQLTKDDLKQIKIILSKMKSRPDFKGRDPERSSSIFPRMVIKDNNEILLFISDEKDLSGKRPIEAVLCTNCKSIIKSFTSVFEDLWNTSSDLEKRIVELETGKASSAMELIKDPKIAKKKYSDALNQARKEILIVTSPKRLNEISNNVDMIRKWCENGVSTKIMAPITTENLKATQKLLSYSEVRHIPVGYRETTIIDGKRLFQFNKPCASNVDDCEILNLENVFFTNDQDFINQTSKSLFEIWEKTRSTSEKHVQPIRRTYFGENKLHKTFKKLDRYGLEKIQHKKSDLTEKKVLTKIQIFNETISKTKVNSSELSNKLYFTGSRAFAVINPSDNFELPDFIMAVFRNEKTSAFGLENNIRIFLKPERKTAPYQLVAVVVDNPKAVEYRRSVFEGMPASKNIILVDRNKLDVKVYGNTLFAGWTIPIPLIPTKYVMPPGCILFEGYGKVDSGMFNFLYPSGRNQEVYYNHLKAFVTFFHPSSKYVGSGIDGFIDREAFQISHPPQK